jgi:hypothetical protein
MTTMGWTSGSNRRGGRPHGCQIACAAQLIVDAAASTAICVRRIQRERIARHRDLHRATVRELSWSTAPCRPPTWCWSPSAPNGAGPMAGLPGEARQRILRRLRHQHRHRGDQIFLVRAQAFADVTASACPSTAPAGEIAQRDPNAPFTNSWYSPSARPIPAVINRRYGVGGTGTGRR